MFSDSGQTNIYIFVLDGSVQVTPVDYQTLRGGSPVADLLYFIFTGTDGPFRAHYYQQLLEHYYAELSAALSRLGLSPAEKYSREDFEFELKEKLPLSMAVSVFILPIVTVEEENAPNVNDHGEVYDFTKQKKDSLFAVRLNEVVDDLIRWRVL